ncbi:MAG: SpoIIE family protein phosphatase [Leptospiraceae bacterium]|nr:SpoIIE family protein phosphatase [Leptospiraceae bacterium]MCP5510946.1 SpoIIE family protein phosphatase [Leptospiraceae bacterium]
MKKILLILLFLISSLSLHSEDNHKIYSLIEVCDDSGCRSTRWWVKDDFQEYYLNSDFSPESSQWIPIDKFPIWLNKLFKIKEDLHTYTILYDFDLPPNFLESISTPGIGFSEIGEAFEIYINGNLIASEGIIKDGELIYHRTVRGVTYHIPREYLNKTQNRLLIKISGNPNYDHTGLYFTRDYLIGDFDSISYSNRDFLSLILTGIYIVFGLYHLFLFFKRNKDRANFYFGFWAISIGVYIYTRSNLIFENPWDSIAIQKTELFVLYPMLTSIIFFFEELFFQDISKPGKIFGFFTLVLSLVTPFLPIHFSEILLLVWQFATLILGIPLMFYRLIQAIRLKIPNAKRILFALIIVSSSAIFDILDSMVFNTGLSFTKFTFFVFVMMVMFILANKLVELHNYTEELNENLEKKVEDRTKELNETLNTVNELKVQQDGDYYLTSLIIQPLGLNLNKSKSIETQFYISQKKKFLFRKRNGELGGDLCVTGNLRFEDINNRYTVFFNGDAMGKSMQGAGGAIVAGTVINNIIGKSARNNRILTDITPEKWLKGAFLELNNIFKTFNGSMLVSGVLGLICEQTGRMIYFNAEHPYVTIYRDGVANFIDSNMYMRKLGTEISEDFVLIQYHLSPGDVLFIGSDGKDDIRLGFDKQMNEDETLFLRNVEKTEGDLNELVQVLRSTGEISDDLSILKISYHPLNPT